MYTIADDRKNVYGKALIKMRDKNKLFYRYKSESKWCDLEM